jgi:BCD family chlorophyll transporter-like MFS transporter
MSGSRAGLGWVGIVRLGLVQASIGAIVMLTTSLLNRVMVVEYAMAAALPAGLVAWHYAVQLSRPAWGHGSDIGRRRTPWIMTGMAMLAAGAVLAVNATVLLDSVATGAIALQIAAFTLIGAGVGAAGTSMLALLAASVAPSRRAAAAAVTWTMMIAGIVIAAGVAGALLDPFSEQRLAIIAGGVVVTALAVSGAAIFRLENAAVCQSIAPEAAAPDFRAALREVLADGEARRFTLFVFVAMLAYSMQDLILEPFAGLVFGFTPGQSTSLAGLQHAGVLAGMVLTGLGGSAFAGRLPGELRWWIVLGCLGSAVALAGLALAGNAGPGWPLRANVLILGFCNGVFAVAAIGAMMGLAGKGARRSEGIRMGIWGAAQAFAFGLGGLTGALGVDMARRFDSDTGAAFALIFAIEAGLFVGAAILAMRAANSAPSVPQGWAAT